MKLTLRALLASRVLMLQIAAAEKLSVYRAAQGESAVEALPVRAILRQSQVSVEV